MAKAVYRENKYNKLTGTFGLLPTCFIRKSSRYKQRRLHTPPNVIELEFTRRCIINHQTNQTSDYRIVQISMSPWKGFIVDSEETHAMCNSVYWRQLCSIQIVLPPLLPRKKEGRLFPREQDNERRAVSGEQGEIKDQGRGPRRWWMMEEVSFQLGTLPGNVRQSRYTHGDPNQAQALGKWIRDRDTRVWVLIIECTAKKARRSHWLASHTWNAWVWTRLSEEPAGAHWCTC